MPLKMELAEGEAVGADMRFEEPLYTLKNLGFYLDRPRRTILDWTGYRNVEPVVTRIQASERQHAEVPFVGLAEALVTHSFRLAGASMQYIRKALRALREETKLENAFASRRLYSHGAQILFDYAKGPEDEKELAEIVTKNRVFTDVVRDHLKLISYGDGDDLWPTKIVLPFTDDSLTDPVVEVDYKRAFGQPLFVRGGARVDDVLDRFTAGDELTHVCKDFGVPEDDVLDILRVVARRRTS